VEIILINTLGLQEAKDSSAIKNMITTKDRLYKSGLISTHSIEFFVADLKIKPFNLNHINKPANF
jgi:hypothetical protein